MGPGHRGRRGGAAGGGIGPVRRTVLRGGEPARMTPEGYRIVEPAPGHVAALAAAYSRNREHLAPWDPRRDADFFTVEGQTAAVAGQLAAVRGGLMAAFVLERDGEIVGRVNLNNIVLGALRSAAVGYWVDADHQGRGLATGAVGFACDEAVRRGLHRVEAGTLLHNTASQRVLERCGFEPYGMAPKFLFIDGAWRDHRLYQRILHDEAI